MVHPLLVGTTWTGGYERNRLVPVRECDLQVAADDKGPLAVRHVVRELGYIRGEVRAKGGAAWSDVLSKRVAEGEICTDDGNGGVRRGHGHDAAL